jgi:hypothetical protein
MKNISQKLNVLLLLVIAFMAGNVVSGQNTPSGLSVVGVILEDENGNRIDAFIKSAPVVPTPTSTSNDVPTPESTILPTLGPTSFPKPTETPDQGRCIARAITNVNVRTEPKITDSNKVDLMTKSEALVIVGQYGEWYQFDWFPSPPDTVWSMKQYWQMIDASTPACKEIPVIPNPFE